MDEYPKTIYTIALTVATKVIESGAINDDSVQRIAADYLQRIGESGIFDQDQNEIFFPDDDDALERVVETVKQTLKDAEFEAACWREYADRLLKQVSQLEGFALTRRQHKITEPT
jgi:hypothetical protein